MTLRARLGWGLLAITVVLIVPLLLSLRSLEHLYETSRLLRDREFAASMLLGSFRERTDDAVSGYRQRACPMVRKYRNW